MRREISDLNSVWCLSHFVIRLCKKKKKRQQPHEWILDYFWLANYCLFLVLFLFSMDYESFRVSCENTPREKSNSVGIIWRQEAGKSNFWDMRDMRVRGLTSLSAFRSPPVIQTIKLAPTVSEVPPRKTSTKTLHPSFCRNFLISRSEF